MTRREYTVESLKAAGPQCAGCHATWMPPAFALENFDDLARYRDRRPYDEFYNDFMFSAPRGAHVR